MTQTTLTIDTPGRALIDFTDQVERVIKDSRIERGLCHVFLQHTSASLLINENADPDVLTDLETFMSGLVSDGDRRFVHTTEGPDDMSAHVRAALTQTSLSIPFSNGKLSLGTWQGLFLWEHRYRPHQRRLIVSLTPIDQS